MAFTAIPPKFRLVSLTLLVFIFIFILLPSSSRSAIHSAAGAAANRFPIGTGSMGMTPSTTPKDDTQQPLEPPIDPRINNATLGFGAIFAMGLPDRTDKRDGMELSATLTGLKLTWFDGVMGADMNPKAIPVIHNNPNATRMKKDAELGCWRAHMNMLQYIIKTNLPTVLILEDDADWDIRIKDQMQQFAVATKDILGRKIPRTGIPELGHTDSPYGEDWDLFWMGHCGGWPPGQDQPFSVIKNDPTVPPAFDMQDMTRMIKKGSTKCAAHANRVPGANCSNPLLAPNERIVQERGSPVCTVGYAVSQHGARKMFARMGGLSLIDLDAQIDTEMTEMCRTSDHPAGAGGPDKIRCIVPSPAYIKPYKARGLMSGDSDIQKSKTENKIRKVGLASGLVWSTRLNAGNLIDGAEPESQYVEDWESEEGQKQFGWRYRRLEEYRAFKKEYDLMRDDHGNLTTGL